MAVIYKPQQPSVWQEMAPYMMQYVQMHMAKKTREEDRAAKLAEQKRLEEFEPSISPNLKGKVGLVEKSPGKWEVVNIPESKKDSVEEKLSERGIYKAGSSFYQMDEKGRLNPIKDPDLPYEIGTIQDFRVGDEYKQHVYTGKQNTKIPGWEPTGVTSQRYKPGINVNVDMGMTKKTKGMVEEKLFNAQENLARLNEITEMYKPEFLEIKTKTKALGTKWQEIGKGTPIEKGLNLLFGKATEKDKELFSEYSSFKRSSINNINLYIKEITGAQMSEKEADRIRLGMPDPGEGLFDGDAPTQFESKLESSMQSLRLSQARYIMYLKKGNLTESQIKKMINSDAAMSLNQVKDIINKEGNALQNQGFSADEIEEVLYRKYFTYEGPQ
jgi:hypothetical protein